MKNFLLTWEDNKGLEHYGWYESEDEMKDFVESNDIKVFDALEIYNSREIDL